ncbi:DUF4251 domain-containing protein [Mucilaginibacter hurinus]|uniref:DUF4251 domain-containing protein n=1 Tax=Mucilaginibacter hurinus TaxID=2201324 RepID=A0A367GSX2_9SPHI|nr:DUF4251 domain-containing protein [Mucilaginibacter hurinus]RCH55871.1 DUF4251 domain-containing protein [Mucilaginibacter hurinus]
MKKLFAIVIVATLLFVVKESNAQNPKADKKKAKELAVKNKIDSVNYTFTANFVTPLGGSQRILQGVYYDLKVTRDTIKAFLPYFGRVYMNPPLNPDDAGVKFTSTNFDYKTTKRKNGGWLITIQFNDTQKSSRMTLYVSENGSATLISTSNYRDAITYYGDITTTSNKKTDQGT